MSARTFKTPLQRIIHEDGRRQDWVAERAGISESWLSTIVHGRIPDDATQQAIARALGRTVDECFPPREAVA